MTEEERLSFSKKMRLWATALMAIAAIRLLGLSVRWNSPHDSLFHEWNRKGMILAFWHSAIFGMLYHFRGSEINVIISQSWDGEIIARTAAGFGHRAVRGSSNRGGSAALRRMARILKEENRCGSVGITPDGPRGPAYHIKPGAAFLARTTGRPVICVSICYDRFWRIGRHWDAFHIPKPFAKALVLVDEPFYVSKEEDSEQTRKRLQEHMFQQWSRARGFFGHQDPPFENPNTQREDMFPKNV